MANVFSKHWFVVHSRDEKERKMKKKKEKKSFLWIPRVCCRTPSSVQHWNHSDCTGYPSFQETILRIFKTDLQEERNFFQALLTDLRMKLVSGKKLNKHLTYMDFPGGSDGKASAYNVGHPGSIPGSGRSPGEGNGNPLQYFLAWKIPWTEEPGRLQSMGSQRVGHNWATSLFFLSLTCIYGRGPGKQ